MGQGGLCAIIAIHFKTRLRVLRAVCGCRMAPSARTRAHPRGAFISEGDWTPTETSFFLTPTCRGGSLICFRDKKRCRKLPSSDINIQDCPGDLAATPAVRARLHAARVCDPPGAAQEVTISFWLFHLPDTCLPISARSALAPVISCMATALFRG